jgi:hypothetical protein
LQRPIFADRRRLTAVRNGPVVTACTKSMSMRFVATRGRGGKTEVGVSYPKTCRPISCASVRTVLPLGQSFHLQVSVSFSWCAAAQSSLRPPSPQSLPQPSPHQPSLLQRSAVAPFRSPAPLICNRRRAFSCAAHVGEEPARDRDDEESEDLCVEVSADRASQRVSERVRSEEHHDEDESDNGRPPTQAA